MLATEFNPLPLHHAPSLLIDAMCLREALPACFSNAWIDCVAQTGSTNSDLLQVLRQRGPGEHTLRIRQADVQTAGRGRLGRPWQARAGDGLLFSLAWPMRRPLSALGGLSLVCGLAVVYALRQALAPSLHNQDDLAALRLKWPNDVLFNGTKLAGILIEAAPVLGTPSAMPTWLVVGIGLNLRRQTELETELGRPLAAVQDLTRDYDPTQLLAGLLGSLANELDAFAQQGFAARVESWQALDAYAGKNVRVLDGDRILHEGRVLGVDADGHLLLETANGMEAVLGGDVSLRPQSGA